MMMRTEKQVLRYTRKFYKRGNPKIYELSRKMGLHPSDVSDACEALVGQDFMKYCYPVVNGIASEIPDSVMLTLKGREPLQYFMSRFCEYLKRNWIAIAALAISIVSFLNSIGILDFSVTRPK